MGKPSIGTGKAPLKVVESGITGICEDAGF